MNTFILHTELIAKRKRFQEIISTLKDDFLGLDSVIDEVTSLMMPWYLFPEAQLRPTVINLWGLTGSGKTALVQRMVELLDFKKLYAHMDMGEFESDSASWIKNIFTDDLEFFHEKPALICLDEFQFAKTLDAHNNELGKDKLRVIWDLLDSGKIDYVPSNSTFYLFRADSCLSKLDKAIKAGVTIREGEVITEVENFIKIFSAFYFNDYNRYNEVINAHYFLSADFIDGVFWLFNDDECSKEYIKERVKASSIQELQGLIVEGLRARPATKQLDLSHSLIFVLGNLDEAYTMSHNLNPDISADEFHEATTKITIADIKRALRKRFRNEQIARLGNNHVIYKSFNAEQFRALIRRELDRVASFVSNQFGWSIQFDSSIVDVVYAEGVFPSQGTRPVFTTVKNLIESRISKLIVTVLEKQIAVTEIRWHYSNERFTYDIYDGNGNVVLSFSDEANLKLENLRKSVNPEIQAHTAVHEAGHAVVAALTLRIIPSVVVSRTASADAEGFCIVNFPEGPLTRDTLKKDIIITLSGYVAEKMIFGEENTSSGVYYDIKAASELVNKAIRQYAMGSDPIYIAVECSDNEDTFYHSEKYTTEAIKIIKSCERQAESILQQNKLLLLKMAEYLTTHSRMEESMIADYVRQYSTKDWVRTKGFIKKDQYYQFNDCIQEQLKELEEGVSDSIIQNLLSDAHAVRKDVV